MVMGAPYGAALNWNYPAYEQSNYTDGAGDQRLPLPTDAVPTPRIDALHVMHLTDPNGVAVTFVTGEALPAWALQYR